MPSTKTAAEFLADKVTVPAEMLTRDWDRVRAATRERAFFMASVTRHEILDAFREAAEEVQRGEVSPARAAEMTRERLLQMGYAPAAGTAGSIKDLTSWRRLGVTIDTNVKMAQGWAGYQRQLAAVSVFPAKRMVRQIAKKEPRNWPRAWQQKAAQVPAEGVNAGDMSAHIAHPIWRALSRFGTPYPPYDFGSGMGDKAIRLDEARKLGVATLPPPLPEEATLTPAEVPGVGTIAPSLNETLEASPDIRTAAVRESLEAELHGAAKWDGERFVYLDPNGTRPATPEALAEIIAARPVPGAPRYQFEAAAQYVTEGAESFTAGSDALYDFARLVHRCTPLDIAPPLWTGRSFASAQARDNWMEGLTEGREADAGFPWLACGLEALGAVAMLDARAAVSVVLTIRQAKRARDLRAVLNAVGPGASQPGIFLEPGARYRVVGTREQLSITQVILEEVEP